MTPSEEEVHLIEGLVRDWTASRGIASPRALLLGATPAIANMRWPESTWLTGIDNSFPMTRRVWPGNIEGERAIVCGSWLSAPVRAASWDIVIGDGSINCLTYPSGFRALCGTVSGLLRGDGLVIFRAYLQAEARESAAQVRAEALRGAINSFHAFKLRLLMALQCNPRKGVAVADVHEWASRNLNLPSLHKDGGWTQSAVETLEYYKGSSTVYAFPTLDEFRSELAPHFEEVSSHVPAHEMGPRCPIFAFRVRRRSA